MENRSYWETLYSSVPATLEKMKSRTGVLSVFNSNIDAVVHTSPERFLSWCSSFDVDSLSAERSAKSIAEPEDLLRGFLHCFENGIAQEWLITNEPLFKQLHSVIGYDRLQMGGQGGIIGNVMSVAGVQEVLVHAASLPKDQAQLFLANDNLRSADSSGAVKQASTIHRSEDTPLIHWILEFDKGDTIQFDGKEYQCPKSNRFIATWDPLNFCLTVDPHFSKAVLTTENDMNFCLLSGYQMLTETLSDGRTSLSRIQESKRIVNSWKAKHSDMTVHFEFASTQDVAVRKELFDEMSPWADSIGLNEQELIDLLEVIDEQELAEACQKELAPDLLLKGLITLFEKCETNRIQLHFFGNYITIRKPVTSPSAESVQQGMALAATCAASKAGSGAIDTHESLLFAADTPVNDTALTIFQTLSNYMKENIDSNSFAETGIFANDSFEIISIPTILIEKPVTLVGMGDTISSLSLVGTF